MLPEARLDVQLTVRLGRVADVRVQSSRLVQAAKLFVGKRPEQVAQLLPVIFSLCGTAQTMAGLAAMEQAAGMPLSSAQCPARQLLILGETVSELGLGLTRDWPMLVGDSPDLTTARRIKTAMAALRPALYPNGDWHHPGGGEVAPDLNTIDTAIRDARDAIDTVLGGAGLNALNNPQSFSCWLRDAPTVVARLIAELSQPEWAEFGRGPFLPMPEDGPPDLAARLEADGDGAYLARPDSAGRVFETGPLARQCHHPLIAAQMGAFGTGLLPRFTAKLIEIAASLHEMSDILPTLGTVKAATRCLVDGAGLGLVEAARGMLAHRVELAGGIVTRYQILAPTEWNFHPDGPLSRGLKGMFATPDLHRRAALLVNGLDPCVACDVAVCDA